MASNYTADPTATQIPSPTPGPGVLPVISVAAGTDAPTIESITQQMKVEADFIGHIQSAVHLDTPVVAGTSGFTAVTYSGFGTGTVTPAGAKISAGLRIVIKIVTPGASGVATYVISSDGGNTFSAVPQTTGTPVIDSTTGITLTFGVGTFNTGGTASFRSGYTPQAQWNDQLGHARTIVDHNGYLVNFGVNEFIEQWMLAPGASGSPWTTSLGAGAAIAVQDPNANYNAPYLQITPSTGALGTSYSIATTRRLFMPNAAMLSAVLEFEIGLNTAAIGTTSNSSFIVGFDNGTDPFGADNQLAFLHKKYNDANWRTTTDDGGLVLWTLTSTPPSANPNNIPVDRVKIEIQGTASPYGVYQLSLFINEKAITTVSASLPTAAVRLVFGSGNEGGAPVGGPLAFLGPVRCVYNYLLSPPSI